MQLPDALGGGEVPPGQVALIDQTRAGMADLFADVVTMLVSAALAGEEGEDELDSAYQMQAAHCIASANVFVIRALASEAVANWVDALIEANGGTAAETMGRMGTPEFVWPGRRRQ